MLKLILQFFVVSFVAASLSGCPGTMPERVQPAADSPMQQAYAAKNDVTIAKKALNDLYAQELNRRKTAPATRPFISDSAYDIAWKTADEAATIADQLIALARGPSGTGKDGMLDQGLLQEAKDKTANVNAIATPPIEGRQGGVPK